MFTALLIGFVFGFVGSMPVAGPIGILVFGRGLEGRARAGLYLGLGSALSEGVYAYLAFWGFAKLLAAHSWIEPVSRGVAAVLLLAIGLRLALKRPPTQLAPALPEPTKGHNRSFLLGMMISALNPTLVLSWGAAVTTLHSLDIVAFSSEHALPFSIGAWLGISGWFSVLTWLLQRFRGRFTPSTLAGVLRALGVVLTILGLVFATRFALYLRSLV
jgi:threonine/homoserine/homoserine lactone efflux protein